MPLGAQIIKTQKSRQFGRLNLRGKKFDGAQAVTAITEGAAPAQVYRTPHNRMLEDIKRPGDLKRKREISRFFFQTNGMYARAVRYLADIYNFYFYIYPNVELQKEFSDGGEKKSDSLLKRFDQVLAHFDNSDVSLLSRQWATQVVIDGAYYGYLCDDIKDRIVVQDLPIDYCRSRFMYRGLPVIEFNCRYFQDLAHDEEARERWVKLFPQEIQQGWKRYKAGGLRPETPTDVSGWIPLDVNRAFKFNFFGGLTPDLPPFLSAIPALIELAEVQDLEKDRLLQQIQQILVQTFSLDKNGQLPFTVEELQEFNQNAVDMIGDAVGVSVLTTLGAVHMENVAANKGNQSVQTVDAAENTVYNDLGLSKNLFNTDGNLALEKSIIADEAFVRPLMLQIEAWLNRYLEARWNKPSMKFRLKMIPSTIFNSKDLSNIYKDLTKIGFSRFLPMICLGHTQKEVISMAKLEQQVLELDTYMLPPFSSNTMSSDTWADVKALQGGKTLTPSSGSSNGSAAGGGRPQKPADQKSEKTIANNEAKS